MKEREINHEWLLEFVDFANTHLAPAAFVFFNQQSNQVYFVGPDFNAGSHADDKKLVTTQFNCVTDITHSHRLELMSDGEMGFEPALTLLLLQILTTSFAVEEPRSLIDNDSLFKELPQPLATFLLRHQQQVFNIINGYRPKLKHLPKRSVAEPIRTERTTEYEKLLVALGIESSHIEPVEQELEDEGAETFQIVSADKAREVSRELPAKYTYLLTYFLSSSEQYTIPLVLNPKKNHLSQFAALVHEICVLWLDDDEDVSRLFVLLQLAQTHSLVKIQSIGKDKGIGLVKNKAAVEEFDNRFSAASNNLSHLFIDMEYAISRLSNAQMQYLLMRQGSHEQHRVEQLSQRSSSKSLTRNSASRF